MMVLVESEPLQFKPIKTSTAQQFVEVFRLHFWDHDFEDRETKQEASGRTLEINLGLLRTLKRVTTTTAAFISGNTGCHI